MRFLIEQSTNSYTHAHTLQDFCAFVCGQLGILEMPTLSLVDSTGAASFGSYRPSSGDVTVATGDRHIADVLRTLAHELVHHVQILSDSPLDLEGLEYEANAVAGMLMREYNREHPELYGVTEPVEGLDSESESGQSFGQGVPTNPPYPTEVAEEVLSEVSTKTLTSYKKRAGHDLRWRTKEDHPGWGRGFEFRYKRTKAGNPRTMQKYLTHRDDPRIIKNRTAGLKQAETTLRKRHGTLQEEGGAAVGGAPINSAGAGNIAGIGIGPQGEPGIQKTSKTPMFKRKPFKQFREQLKETPWQTF